MNQTSNGGLMVTHHLTSMLRVSLPTFKHNKTTQAIETTSATAFTTLPASTTVTAITTALASTIADPTANNSGPGLPLTPGSTSAVRREHPPPAPPLPALPLLSPNSTKRGVTTFAIACGSACRDAATRAPSGVAPLTGVDRQRWWWKRRRAEGEFLCVGETPAARGRERDALCAGERERAGARARGVGVGCEQERCTEAASVCHDLHESDWWVSFSLMVVFLVDVDIDNTAS